jgi:hypothetical protein
MAIINRFRAFRRQSVEESVPAITTATEDTKTDSVVAGAVPVNDISHEKGSEHNPERPSEDVQRGVKNIEATTLTWTKRTLIAVFIKFVLTLFCRSPALS